MALHKIKVTQKDGSCTTFFENKDGTWDACIVSKERDDIPNWVNSLPPAFMIGTVCAASDLGATIKIERGEDF